MCFGFGSNAILIPPTAKAVTLKSVLRGILIAHLAYAIVLFAGQQFFNAIIDSVLVMIAYMATRLQPPTLLGYDVQKLMCYFMLTAMNALWAIIRLILVIADKFSSLSNSLTYVIAIGGVVIYTTAAIVSYMLYSELRNCLPDDPHYYDRIDAMMGIPPENPQQQEEPADLQSVAAISAYDVYGSGNRQAAPGANARDAPYRVGAAANANRSAASTGARTTSSTSSSSSSSSSASGFRPFTGQGHRLG